MREKWTTDDQAWSEADTYNSSIRYLPFFFTFVVDIGLRPVVEMFTVFCVLVRSSYLVSRVSAFN